MSPDLPGRNGAPPRQAGFDSTATIPSGLLASSNVVSLDLSRHVIVRGSSASSLSVREVEALILLADRPGTVVRRSDLVRAIWGDQPPSGARALDMVIRRIREKLGPAAEALRSVRGVGFVLVAHPELDVTTRPG